MTLTAPEIIDLLGLQKHPTRGFETCRSSTRIPSRALRDDHDGSRPFGSVLYFLVTPEAQNALHPLSVSDDAGGPL